MGGSHCLKSWSTTQGPIALSSAEAEYDALVEGVKKAMGVKTPAAEIGILGMGGAIDLLSDSSGAKSFASRRGFGRCRHTDTKCLWLRQAILNSEVVVRKISGTRNPADVLTKYLPCDSATKMLQGMGVAMEWRPSARRARAEGCV